MVASSSVAGTGSCLCGGVVYAIEGELRGLINCHCSRCRRARATAHIYWGSKAHWFEVDDELPRFNEGPAG